MSFKNNIKQRNKTVQGLRSFKDTLPTSIKRIIKKKGHIFSETLNNWRHIAGIDLFKVSYPKSFKNSNRLGVGTLEIMVKRGKEVDLEYSKKKIIDQLNGYFGYVVVEKLKFISFDDTLNDPKKSVIKSSNNNKNKHLNKILNIKNDKIKKSLIVLTKLFNNK